MIELSTYSLEVLGMIKSLTFNAAGVRIRALSKKSTPELAPLQIKDLVTDIQALVQHELTQRRIALKTTLAGDLSPVLGDRIQLQQVLLKLVVNSIDAMKKVPEDRRQLSIEALACLGGRVVCPYHSN